MDVQMKKVFICSPLNASSAEGKFENILYVKRCIWDSIKRGEAPYAPHLFLTMDELLDDLIPGEREMGIKIGLAWGDWADLIAVYTDRGVSPGMQAEIDRYTHRGTPIEMRSIHGKATIGG